MILLDTHVLVWCALDDTSRMSASRMEEIDAAVRAGEAAVSAVTFWELEHIRRRRREDAVLLPPTEGVRLRLLADGLREIAPTGDVLVRAVGLQDDGFHKDPMDRIIVATALAGSWRLATADARIRSWATATGRLELFDTGG